MRNLIALVLFLIHGLAFAGSVNKIVDGDLPEGFVASKDLLMNNQAETAINIYPSEVGLGTGSLLCNSAGTTYTEVISGRCSYQWEPPSTANAVMFVNSKVPQPEVHEQMCAGYFRYQYGTTGLGANENAFQAFVGGSSSSTVYSTVVTIPSTHDVLNGNANSITRVGIIPPYPCQKGVYNRLYLKHVPAVSGQNIVIDDFHVYITPAPLSLKVSTNRTLYTPTLTGFGTPTNMECYQWQDGEFGNIDCKFNAGTTTAVNGQMTIPWTMATWTTGAKAAGEFFRGTSTANHGGTIIINSATNYLQFSDASVFGSTASNALNAVNASTAIATGEAVHIKAKVPIAGASNLNGVPAGLADTAFAWAGAMTIGGTTTAPTKGTISVDRIGYALSSDGAKIRGEYKQTAAGAAGTGDYLFTLPAGLQFDSSKVTLYTGQLAVGVAAHLGPASVGSANFSDSNNNGSSGYVIPYDATRFRIYLLNVASGGTSKGFLSSTLGHFGVATVTVSFDFWAPMVGRVVTNGVMSSAGSEINTSATVRVRNSFASTTYAICNTTPCPLATSSGDLVITRTSGGTYVATASPPYGGVMACSGSSVALGTANTVLVKSGLTAPTTSTYTFETRNPTSLALLDSAFDIRCWGLAQ